MASPLDALDRIPIWQRLIIFVMGAVAVGAIWYFVYYQETVDAQNGARVALKKADAELARVKKEKENFLERQRKLAEVEEDLQKKMEVLPMTTASVDNLMQTFQQQARLVGLTVESWVPSAEQKEDFSGRLPIKVQATGSWTQAGEFFRRVSELDRIVSIENVEMRVRASSDKDAPELELTFEAVTYRFLGESERASGGKNRRRKQRRNR